MATNKKRSFPLNENKCFGNPWVTWTGLPNIVDVTSWWFKQKKHSKEALTQHLIVETPMFSPNPSRGIVATWLGHSTVLVQMDGCAILTDPVFTQRCSPFFFAGPERLLPVPCTVENLPEIDAVVISHNHYDHLDKATVCKLLEQPYGRNLQWFVPMGLREWFLKVGCKEVVEQSWWDESTLLNSNRMKLVCLPSQHWSGRAGYLDQNKSLWCSWAVIGEHSRFFFAGDTGYCPAFQEIGDAYGPFDLAAIPIGCYEPREFMRNQHINPAEAVVIHQQIKARYSLGIHWGTYDMGSSESYEDPKIRLGKEVVKHKLKSGEFFTLNHGQSWIFPEIHHENVESQEIIQHSFEELNISSDSSDDIAAIVLSSPVDQSQDQAGVVGKISETKIEAEQQASKDAVTDINDVTSYVEKLHSKQ